MSRNHSWTDKIIRGQQCLVPNFGLGRVMDFGHEANMGGYDYILVKFYADPTHPQIRRFAPEAVNLLDPTGRKRTPYKAREPKKNRARPYKESARA
jgi:hypothetical protein